MSDVTAVNPTEETNSTETDTVLVVPARTKRIVKIALAATGVTALVAIGYKLGQGSEEGETLSEENVVFLEAPNDPTEES